jgi:hypothetical protein
VRRLPPALLALPLFAVSRAVPAEGAGLWLRLVAATLVVLLPGLLAARALRLPGASGGLTWALAAVGLALAVTVLVHASLALTLALTLAAAAAVLPIALRVQPRRPAPAEVLTALAGLGFGIALWFVEGVLRGDALFHLGRVRKLDAFDALSLHAVDEFRDGGLHPGYAFPVWHAFVALVARLADVDPTAAVLHEASVLAPLAFLVAYEAGAAVFRSRWLGVAVATAQVTLVAVAPGGGGPYTSLALPASVGAQLLTPAIVALVFSDAPPRTVVASVAVGGCALALIHPTYALFLLIVLCGFVGVRALVAPRRLGRAEAAVAGLGAGAVAVLAALAPVARDAAAQTPSRAEVCRSLERYRTEIVGSCGDGYHLAAEIFSRRGSLAVAALVLVPAAALAAGRRWAALVLGGTVVLAALELLPFLFPRFAAVVSLSQARRAAGFVPLAIALSGGAALLARMLGPAVLPLALGAGIGLHAAYPGDFGARLDPGGAAWPAWVAGAGGAAAIAGVALARGRRPRVEGRAGLAAVAVALLALPVAVHGFSRWDASHTADAYALSPGLVRFLRERVPPRSVVFSNLETSYRISAYAPVYVAAAPPAHVADTPANAPRRRRRAVIEFGKTGDLAIPRRFGAEWLVIDRARPHAPVPLAPAYRDRRYSVFALS